MNHKREKKSGNNDSAAGLRAGIFSGLTPAVLVIAAVIILFGGCSSGEKHPDFLTAHNWIHYDDICDEVINFGTGGEFSFHCACGEPVGDSDLYEEYTYDESSGSIKLKPSGNMKIKVLRYEKSRLLLEIDGVIKEFIDADDELIADAGPQYLEYDSKGITGDFCSYIAILEKNGIELVTAPANYDGDIPTFKEYCLKEKVAEGAEFFEWNLQIVENSQGIYAEDSCKKLTEQEASEIIAGGSAVGFVWYNENAEITKIVLYGSTVHYE